MWAQQRSMNIASTSKKMRRWRGVSSRFWSRNRSVEDTIAILRGLKERYEVHHGVRIKDSAIIAAATLSHRYIADRFLPDKAVDLIDEAASRLRIELDSMPSEIDVIDRKIIQLEIERQSLKNETDKTAKERRAKIDKELAELKKSMDQMKLHWSGEKDIIKKIQNIKSQMESLKTEEANAQREGNLARAAEIRYGKLVELNKESAGRSDSNWRKFRKIKRCSKKKWMPKMWPKLSPTGQAFRFPA